MISYVFHAAFYNPIYNVLVALVSYIPGGDVGVALVLMTLLIQIVLLPFSLAAARTQVAMKVLEPKLKALKELHKGDKEKEAVATLELYKAERVNPFASVLMLLIQLPVMLALYWVFRYEPFTSLDMARLYSFTPLPHVTSTLFLGFINIASKSVILALIAGFTQYILALLTPAPSTGGAQGDFSKALNMQMRYVFPVLIAVVAYSTSSAIAIYFIALNAIRSVQQWYVNKHYTPPAL